MSDSPHPIGKDELREEKSPFIDPRDLPKTKLVDGTEVKVSHKMFRMKKSRLGRRYNGKHRD